MLVQLLYISTPKEGERDSINASLPFFQERNKKKGLGGMILSHPKFIIQLLEGERTNVNKIYGRVVRDPRHENITLLRYIDIRRMEFDEWNFAIVNNDKVDDSGCAEFIEMMNPHLDAICTDISSSTAMAIIKKAAMHIIVANAPHRRKTDIKEIPNFDRG